MQNKLINECIKKEDTKVIKNNDGQAPLDQWIQLMNVTINHEY